VRVVSVITGAVDTNNMRNSAAPKLPSSSMYLAAKKQITNLAIGVAEDGVQRMAIERLRRR
jgi:1-acylglycerone phosphate reductase